MYRNAVFYKGGYLAPNSKAMELYELSKKDKKVLKQLDEHLKELDTKYKALQGV